jgi:hypothetical protein
VQFRRFTRAWQGRILGAAVFVPLLAAAQTNSWTSTQSGSWETNSWSLGTLPGSGQTVLLTNAGWKAVEITGLTVGSHPETLSVDRIYLSAPPDSFNELLLNYAGTGTPLTCGTLLISSNTSVVALNSSVNVVNSFTGGGFSVGGTFAQGAGSVVTAGLMRVGDIGPGAYYVTNGTLNVQTEYIGAAGSGVGNALFEQQGGTHSVSTMHLLEGAHYQMRDGQLNGHVQVADYPATGWFTQSGGTVTATNSIDVGSGGFGYYTMLGGLLTTPQLNIPLGSSQSSGRGTFVQAGGTNTSTNLNIALPYGSIGSYTLSNGVLRTATSMVGQQFYQYGGVHEVSAALNLMGTAVSPSSANLASYTLQGGSLSARTVSINTASFSQTGGTNIIAEDLSLAPGSFASAYSLAGGLLQVSNCAIAASYNGGFVQSNGTHTVTGLLRVNGSAYEFAGYKLAGGQLTAANIVLEAGGTFHFTSGTLNLSGLLTLSSGNFEPKAGAQVLGQLLLSSGYGNTSTLAFPASSCTVRLADSHTLAWSNSASLLIDNWNGSVAGGGSHQLIFGQSSAAVSPAQLSRISFHNPLGLTGNYPAQILPTGELVPGPALFSSTTTGKLVLQWSAASALQSATNINGPYFDIAGASSPFTNNFHDPLRFFRLKL